MLPIYVAQFRRAIAEPDRERDECIDIEVEVLALLLHPSDDVACEPPGEQVRGGGHVEHEADRLGIIAFADFFPNIVMAPLAGALADRTDRLPAIRLYMFISGVISVALAALVVGGFINIELLLAMVILNGTAMSFNYPVRLSIIHSLVGHDALASAIGINALAFNIARHAAEHGARVGIFSLEMSAEQLAARILSEVSGVPSEQIRRGDMTETEFRKFVDAAKQLEACPLYIDDTPALPISQLAARARRLKRTHGLDALFVDYLHLVRPASAKENRVNEISEITQGLKAIAKELDIPVMALSQLSRQVENREDKRPQLSDLRESGSIEQDADVVMFVYREEYYKEREKPGDHDLEAMGKWQADMEAVHGKAEIIIGKQRHGPIGQVELSFEGKFTRFGNLVKPWQHRAEDY